MGMGGTVAALQQGVRRPDIPPDVPVACGVQGCDAVPAGERARKRF